MKKQYLYITSLKGIACLLVALGHFLGTVKYATNFPLDAGWFSFLQTCRLDFLVNESFWLYLFFVVSGYLLAHSAIRDLPGLILQCVLRFLRLALPIFCACAVIFLLSKIVPFYNSGTSALFENSWLQSDYSAKLTFTKMLLSPLYVLLVGNVAFNAPYWVLRSMLIASFLIYFANYILSKVRSGAFRLVFVLAVAAAAFLWDKVVFSCVAGAVLGYYEDSIRSAVRSKIGWSLLGAAFFGACFISSTYGGILFFAWLILATPCFTGLQNTLERKPLQYLGEISFGIYSFHWPVFCSVGALLIVRLWDSLGGNLALLCAIAAAAAITAILSVGYHYALEIPSGQLVGWVKSKGQQLISARKHK